MSGTADKAVDVPCGQCIGCKLQRSVDWAVRCVHESQLYEDNCFITLTYRPKDLPVDGSLCKRDFQLFMKRLRKEFVSYFLCVIDGVHRSIPVNPIRFFHCGEYGEKLSRPHYHACLFNFDFEDKQFFSERDGCVLYTSEALERLWPLGFSTVGDFTFETAAYCARYCVKKINGLKAVNHYVDKETGVVLSPEYATMSRRPGIGRYWFDKFGDEVFPFDEVLLRGAILKPPRYYSNIYELSDPEGFLHVQRKRKDYFGLHEADSTPPRLRQREVVKRAQVGLLKRSFEEC